MFIQKNVLGTYYVPSKYYRYKNKLSSALMKQNLERNVYFSVWHNIMMQFWKRNACLKFNEKWTDQFLAWQCEELHRSIS